MNFAGQRVELGIRLGSTCSVKARLGDTALTIQTQACTVPRRLQHLANLAGGKSKLAGQRPQPHRRSKFMVPNLPFPKTSPGLWSRGRELNLGEDVFVEQSPRQPRAATEDEGN